MECVREHLPASVAMKDVEVWFQDEARFGQQNTLSRIWVETGSRPGIERQQQYEYAYLFGAVCPAGNKAVALAMPCVNTRVMALHLQEISKATPEGKHAVVIADRAGWHMSQKLPEFANLTLIPLPPYSPELNAAEQLWQWLRQHYLSNRRFDSYEDLIGAICEAWNKLCAIPGKLKELCSREWTVIA